METNIIDGNFVNFLAPIQIYVDVGTLKPEGVCSRIGVLIQVNFINWAEGLSVIVCVYLPIV